MDTILHDLLNTMAPLVVQILAAVVLAALSGLLLKGRQLLESRLTVQQQDLLREVASTAVHFAENQGIGKAGEEKAALARKFVDRELAAVGITVVSGSDIEAAIIGAVQRAWAHEIGPTGPTPDQQLNQVLDQVAKIARDAAAAEPATATSS